MVPIYCLRWFRGGKKAYFAIESFCLRKNRFRYSRNYYTVTLERVNWWIESLLEFETLFLIETLFEGRPLQDVSIRWAVREFPTLQPLVG